MEESDCQQICSPLDLVLLSAEIQLCPRGNVSHLLFCMKYYYYYYYFRDVWGWWLSCGERVGEREWIGAKTTRIPKLFLQAAYELFCAVFIVGWMYDFRRESLTFGCIYDYSHFSLRGWICIIWRCLTGFRVRLDKRKRVEDATIQLEKVTKDHLRLCWTPISSSLDWFRPQNL